MNEIDSHRALTDGGRDPLHRVESHITRREQPGYGRLQRERDACQRPAGAVFAVEQIAAGDDEAVLVTRDFITQPVRAWRGPDVHEEPVGVDVFLRAGGAIGEREALEVVGTSARDDLGLQAYLD